MAADEQHSTGSTVDAVLSVLLTGGYLWWLWYSRSGARTPPKQWLTHHASKAAENLTAWAWDTTLKLRRYYRRETEGN